MPDPFRPRRSSRAERRRLARERARAGRPDPAFVCAAEKACFVIREAERLGCNFAIEGTKLAIVHPLDLPPATWADIQRGVRDNLRFVVGIVRVREEMGR